MKEIENIIFKDPRITFMEILKVNGKEVPFANLLSFFFKPKEKHNLGTLFIDSLLETKFTNIGKNDTNEQNFEKIEYDRNSVKVMVELKTLNNNRIDIFIATNTFVICIEFKINHNLDNPLEDYKNFISRHSEYSTKKQFYFILTPFKKEPIGNAKRYFENNNEFKQIVLRHFIKQVKLNLENKLSEVEHENIYYQYFQDFIQTVENREIRSKRTFELTKLNDIIIQNSLKSEYHTNIQGGFLQVEKINYNLKIRIKFGKWQVEKWNGNIKDMDICKLDKDIDFTEFLNVLKKN